MIKVYHMTREHYRKFISSEAMFSMESPGVVDLGQYELVASVRVEGFDLAFRLTNHIDHDWTENQEVVVLTNNPVRSTSGGDLMEKDGKFFFLGGMVGMFEVEVTGHAHF